MQRGMMYLQVVFFDGNFRWGDVLFSICDQLHFAQKSQNACAQAFHAYALPRSCVLCFEQRDLKAWNLRTWTQLPLPPVLVPLGSPWSCTRPLSTLSQTALMMRAMLLVFVPTTPTLPPAAPTMLSSCTTSKTFLLREN